MISLLVSFAVLTVGFLIYGRVAERYRIPAERRQIQIRFACDCTACLFYDGRQHNLYSDGRRRVPAVADDLLYCGSRLCGRAAFGVRDSSCKKTAEKVIRYFSEADLTAALGIGKFVTSERASFRCSVC